MLRNDFTTGPSEPGIRQTLIRASGAVASRLWETVRVTLVVQGVVVLVGIPFLAWLFPVLLQVLGASSVTAIDLGELLRHPVAATVISVLLLGMDALALAQVLIFLVVAGRRFRIDPASPALWIELFALTRRLDIRRPSCSSRTPPCCYRSADSRSAVSSRAACASRFPSRVNC
jgi:hypothetical protein